MVDLGASNKNSLYSLNSRNSLITSIKLSIIFGTLLEHSSLCNEKNHYSLIKRGISGVIAWRDSRYIDRYMRGSLARGTLRAVSPHPFRYGTHRRREDVYEWLAGDKKDSPCDNAPSYIRLLAQYERRYGRGAPRDGNKSIYHPPILAREIEG